VVSPVSLSRAVFWCCCWEFGCWAIVGVKIVVEVAVERAAALRDFFNSRVVLVEIPCGESIVKLLFWPSEWAGVEGLNA